MGDSCHGKLSNDIAVLAAHQIPIHAAPPQTLIYNKLVYFAIIIKLTKLRRHKPGYNEKLYLILNAFRNALWCVFSSKKSRMMYTRSKIVKNISQLYQICRTCYIEGRIDP
jgi:hypothetical protein